MQFDFQLIKFDRFGRNETIAWFRQKFFDRIFFSLQTSYLSTSTCHRFEILRFRNVRVYIAGKNRMWTQSFRIDQYDDDNTFRISDCQSQTRHKEISLFEICSLFSHLAILLISLMIWYRNLCSTPCSIARMLVSHFGDIICCLKWC